MTPRRARISDNDPLNPTRTEKVLERFEQSNQPSSEPTEQSTSQQDFVGEQPESNETEQLTPQQVKEIPEEPSLHKNEQANEITSQPDDKTATKATSTQTRPQAKKSASQKVDQSASQQEELTAIELKKATFQLDKAVLTKLERFVLGLQLELGKENAPYKEVIVEEAIERLLNNDPTRILKALERRQKRRK